MAQAFNDYQTQFGSLNFVKGEHCTSILSASAYMLALLRFKEAHIDETTTPEVCRLKNRRPDLWQIPLDCQNTNTIVSYVEIINGILEQQEEGIYDKLKSGKFPFNLPYDRSRNTITGCLKKLNVDPATLYKTLLPTDKEADPKLIAQTFLSLSPDQVAMLTTDEQSEAKLAAYYGFGPDEKDFAKQLLDVKTFCKKTGLTYDQLRELLRQNLSKEERKTGVLSQFFINAGGDGSWLVASKGVFKKTKDGDTLEDLDAIDPTRLDLINRFIRLANILGISFTELYWILRVLFENKLDEETLQGIALIKKIQGKLKQPLESICGLCAPAKNIGKGERKELNTLFDLIFNTPFQGSPDHVALPNDKIKIETVREQLLGALNTDLKSFNLICEQLGFNQTTTDVTLENLSLLYRLSWLPKLLGISVADFFMLIPLIEGSDYQQLSNSFSPLFPIRKFSGAIVDLFKSGKPLDVLQLIDLLSEITGWLKQEDIPVPELHLMCTGAPNRQFGRPLVDLKRDVFSAFRKNLLIYLEARNKQIHNIAQEANQLKNLIQKTDAEVADLLDTTCEDPQKIKEQLTLIDKKIEALTAEETAPSRQKALALVKQKCALFQKTLETWPDHLNTLKTRTDQEIQISLGNCFSVSPGISEKIGKLLQKWLNIAEEGYMIDFVESLNLQARAEDDSFQDLDDGDFLKLIQQWLHIAQKVSLSIEEATLLGRDAKFFNFPTDTASEFFLSHIRTIYDFHSFSTRYADKRYPLSQYFPQVYGTSGDEYSGEQLSVQYNKLSQLTGWDLNIIEQAQPKLFSTLTLLHEKHHIADLLNLSLTRAEEKVWDQLWGDSANPTAVATLLDAQVYRKVDVEERKKFRLELAHQNRQALVPYIIELVSKKVSSLGVEINTTRELYEYLLIDVEMGTVVETSPVREGITSLRTYLERQQLNMDIGGEIAWDKREAFEKQWKWMRSYRLWEANRKVFLYPENYIKPELRKDKSELFKAFEDTIKKSEVNAETVEQAFRGYLDEVSKISKLSIAGSCAYQVPNEQRPEVEDDIFVLFGRTR